MFRSFGLDQNWLSNRLFGKNEPNQHTRNRGRNRLWQPGFHRRFFLRFGHGRDLLFGDYRGGRDRPCGDFRRHRRSWLLWQFFRGGFLGSFKLFGGVLLFNHRGRGERLCATPSDHPWRLFWPKLLRGVALDHDIRFCNLRHAGDRPSGNRRSHGRSWLRSGNWRNHRWSWLLWSFGDRDWLLGIDRGRCGGLLWINETRHRRIVLLQFFKIFGRNLLWQWLWPLAGFPNRRHGAMHPRRDRDVRGSPAPSCSAIITPY